MCYGLRMAAEPRFPPVPIDTILALHRPRPSRRRYAHHFGVRSGVNRRAFPRRGPSLSLGTTQDTTTCQFTNKVQFGDLWHTFDRLELALPHRAWSMVATLSGRLWPYYLHCTSEPRLGHHDTCGKPNNVPAHQWPWAPNCDVPIGLTLVGSG